MSFRAPFKKLCKNASRAIIYVLNMETITMTSLYYVENQFKYNLISKNSILRLNRITE